MAIQVKKIAELFAFFSKFVSTRISVIFVLAYMTMECPVPEAQMWAKPVAYAALGFAYVLSIALERFMVTDTYDE